MPKTRDFSKETVGRYVVIGEINRFRDPLPEGVTLCRASDLKSCVEDARSGAVFVSCASGSTDALLKARLKAERARRFEHLLTMEPPRTESVPAILGVFSKVIGLGGYRWLPVEELIRVVTGKDAVDRFIGGAADIGEPYLGGRAG